MRIFYGFLTKSLNRFSMKIIGKQYLGKDYDAQFDWSDKKIYCSELVWKVYYHSLNLELGELQKLSSFNLSNPAVKKKLQQTLW